MFDFRLDPGRPVPLAAIARAVAAAAGVNVVLALALATRIGSEAIGPAFLGTLVAGLGGFLCVLPSTNAARIKLQLLMLAGLLFEGRGLPEAWASQSLWRLAWRLHVFVPMVCVVLFLLGKSLQRSFSERET